MLSGNPAEQWLQPYLQPREHLLWSGRPAQGLRLRMLDLYMVPSSIFFVGFGVFTTLSTPTLLFSLLGILIVLVGIYSLIGHFSPKPIFANEPSMASPRSGFLLFVTPISKI